MRRCGYVILTLRRLVLGCVVGVCWTVSVAAPAALAAFRPVVGKELVAEVATTKAKLGALVNPGGAPATYHFEYGVASSYGSSTPFPEDSAGEGSTARSVWAAAINLVQGTTYHYRVAVTNERGTTYGPDQTFTTLTAEQAACPNDEFRSGPSAQLPDCRAYELVTPVVKTSVQFFRLTNRGSLLADDGEAIGLSTHEPLPDAANGGNFYLATRNPSRGWTVTDISPPEPYTGVVCPSHNAFLRGFSADLFKALIELGDDTSATEPEPSEACNADGLQVVPGEPVGRKNLLVRDNTAGTYQIVNTPPPGVTPNDAYFEGASADLSHVVFGELSPLTANAPLGVEDIYEWDEGALRLLTVLPNETPAAGSFVEGRGGEARYEGHGISADGSRILFTSGGNLYDRIDGNRTVWVDESQEGADPGGGGSFKAATADGLRVLFLDTHRLTRVSTAGSEKPDLYECELPIPLPAAASTCRLTDLTVAKAGEHADVLAVSPLGPHDSSDVYFVARSVLATNTREYLDSEGKPVSEGAQGGQPNLYLWDGKTTRFVATLAETDTLTGQTSPDGAWFGFMSLRSLTGYDSASSLTGRPVPEYFLYSAASGQLVCASCKPTGEAPELGPDRSKAVATISASGPPRYVSDNGRLFFETSEELVPSDTNGHVDVYAYENGEAHLISSGTSSSDAVFTGTSETGDDVSFNVAQALVPQDNQEDMVVGYDARVGGGFPSASTPPACATDDACRAPVSPQPSIYGAPSSQTFTGAGNVAPSSEATKPPKKKKKKKQKVKQAACMHGKRNRARCARRRARAVRSEQERSR